MSEQQPKAGRVPALREAMKHLWDELVEADLEDIVVALKQLEEDRK